MRKKDINSKPYDEATMLKLDIFRKCFREWYPVFVHNPIIESIYIYDMFAGSGHDANGKPGSPLILLEEAKGDKCQYCEALHHTTNKNVLFGFNEKDSEKIGILKSSVKEYFTECRSKCKLGTCVYIDKVYFQSDTFDEIKQNSQFNTILQNPKWAKFILLDQYGFSQITDDTFLKLVASPTTDFIFFISSSFVKRFKEHPNITKYLDTNKMNFEESKPKECHRIIANYFRDLINKEKEYYIHHFTIQKGSNYYGLIFGTNHSLGMEKFVKVCWSEDKLSGESNCNIDNDFEKNTLFYNPAESSKKTLIRNELAKLLLEGHFANNLDGLKWTLSKGCEPKLFVETISALINEGKVKIEGKFNKQASKIHQINTYKIVAI